jgi:hypothetical protein
MATHPGQGSGDDTLDDAPSDTPERHPRTPRGASTQLIVKQRVDYVRALYVNGFTTAEICRRVARAHDKEADTRKRHAKATALGDTAKATAALAKLPPLVWGTGPRPPDERTIDRYIARAKLSIQDGGKSAAKLGDRLFGIQLERINLAWRMATRTKNPSAMARIIELTNDLFAFDGAIRPQLSALSAGTDDARPGGGEKDPPPDASMTLESAAREVGDMLARARAARTLATTRTEATA